uniref:Nitroreductase domain-containing protein n=1 Tax=Amphora coffeiformis TaxID=265554 RepID=A0A7S3L5S3_9STRA|mmetsp:Transcript_5452/g.10562  ORF Transcript_5452/g.10562 Transcript_5452/m.10562 type:complete len:353 (-) Transcript_5452:40-1098(-)
MNASYAFRSHLMQQFAAQARTQSRPPLALIGLLTEDSSSSNNGSTLPDPVVDSSSWKDASGRFRHLSSIETSSKSSVNLRRRHTDSDIFRSSGNQSSVLRQQFSTEAHPQDFEPEEEECGDSSQLEGNFNLPSAFQSLLQTRRTTSRFSALTSPTPIYEEADYWNDALERAVLCGYQAPNHKRTEPFTFKRMVAPTESTERLANIAYNVALRKGKNEEKAEKKRDKWSQIPAFLVATVEEESLYENDLETLNEYDQLPYIPPQSERALEDYASACAAVQNVLLSLHSEDIATKWATGPVIQTPAFRELVQAKDNDRVVALIMVGQALKSKPKKRKIRRPLRSGSADDILVDV